MAPNVHPHTAVALQLREMASKQEQELRTKLTALYTAAAGKTWPLGACGAQHKCH